MRSLASLAAACVLVPCLAAPAYAQHTHDPSKSDASKAEIQKMEAARQEAIAARAAELFKKGADLAQQGKCDEALGPLEASWSLKKDPSTAVVLGTCEVKQKRWRDGAEHLYLALRTLPEGEERRKAEATFAEARVHVGGLKISTGPDGADVFVGDRFAGQTPLDVEVFVDPGEALVVAKKMGYDETSTTVKVAANKTLPVQIRLLKSGESDRTYAPRNRTKVPIFVLGGLGLVAAGVGVGLYVAAGGKASEADNTLEALKKTNPIPCGGASPPAACATLLSLRQSRDKTFNAGTGAVVAGGVLLTAAAVYAIWALQGNTSEGRVGTGSRVKFVPVASPQGGGLWLHGAF